MHRPPRRSTPTAISGPIRTTGRGPPSTQSSAELRTPCGLTPPADLITAGQRRATDESACTPGSVPGCLAASRWAVIHLGLPLPAGSSGLPAGIGRAALERLRRTAENRPPSRPCSGWGLPSHTGHPVCGGLLHRRFTLTSASAGGLFSVALSRGSPRVAVSDHPALWSPDVPRRQVSPPTRPPSRLVRRVDQSN